VVDDVERISRGQGARQRGTGSRLVPHRLNRDERVSFDIAKKLCFLQTRGTGYRKERKDSPLNNTFRQWCDAKRRPWIAVQKGSGSESDPEIVLVDFSPLRRKPGEPLLNLLVQSFLDEASAEGCEPEVPQESTMGSAGGGWYALTVSEFLEAKRNAEDVRDDVSLFPLSPVEFEMTEAEGTAEGEEGGLSFVSDRGEWGMEEDEEEDEEEEEEENASESFSSVDFRDIAGLGDLVLFDVGGFTPPTQSRASGKSIAQRTRKSSKSGSGKKRGRRDEFNEGPVWRLPRLLLRLRAPDRVSAKALAQRLVAWYNSNSVYYE